MPQIQQNTTALNELELESPEAAENKNENVLEKDTTQVSPTLKQYSYPEGGLRAWLTVLGGWCAIFYTFGYVNSFGVYESYYLDNILHDETASAIAWIGSIETWAQLSASLISGPMCDQYGPKIIVWPCSVLHVISLMLTSLCKKYYQFVLCQGVLTGICSGLIFAPATAVVGHYFHQKRPLAMSILSTGGTVGGIVFPVILTKLLYNSSVGFAWTQRIIGFVTIALAIIACITVRPGIGRRKGSWFISQAFLKPAYSFQVLGLFLINLGLWTPFFYLATYGLEHGMSQQVATYLVAVLNAGSLVGRLVAGYASQLLGQFNVMVFACFASAILLFCWLRITSATAIVLLAVLYGATSGAIIALMVATISHVTSHPNEIGTYLGMASGIYGLASLIGTPITGAMISHYGEYKEAIIFSGSLLLSGAVSMFLARYSYAGWKSIV